MKTILRAPAAPHMVPRLVNATFLAAALPFSSLPCESLGFVTLSGKATRVVELSLNGSAPSSSATDVVTFSESDMQTEKVSRLRIRTNLPKWKLTAKAGLPENVTHTEDLSLVTLQCSSVSGSTQPLATEPVKLSQYREPKAVAAALGHSDAHGVEVRIRYSCNAARAEQRPIVAIVQYSLTDSP